MVGYSLQGRVQLAWWGTACKVGYSLQGRVQLVCARVVHRFARVMGHMYVWLFTEFRMYVWVKNYICFIVHIEFMVHLLMAAARLMLYPLW